MIEAIAATDAVKKALATRADALEAEADEMMEKDHNARAKVGSAPMLVFVKQQVAQEFRNLASHL